MYIHYDEDEFETVITSRPCTACNGDRKKCHGQCNGMASYGSRRRSPAEVKAIKEKRRLEQEAEILAQADAIRTRRGSL